MLKTPAQSGAELYSAEQLRALDAALIAAGTSGFTLMQRAAAAAWTALQSRWSQVLAVDVLVGGGNNAGDGYVLAALAQQAGWSVRVWYLVEPQRLQGDAQRAWAYARELEVAVQPWVEGCELQGVVVDALLGLGLKGEVRPAYVRAIEAINSSRLPVLAMDIPSGLCADTGAHQGCAVRADVTVSFIAWKLGLFTADAVDHVGDLLLASLTEDALPALSPVAARLKPEGLAKLAARKRGAHKGQCGRVLVLGGELGMAGAAALTAQAALRTGAGLVSVATRPASTAALLARCPEVMALGVSSANQVMSLLAQADVLLVGPGLGQGPWARSLISAAASSSVPVQVWDADALNLLAQGVVRGPKGLIMTPHPGEAARLLGCSIAQVQANRPWAVQALAQQYQATVVLKGAGSLIVGGSGMLALCDSGHPVMAGAGLGDVLTGIIGALVAQGMAAEDAARLGVWLHASAGERLANEGRGLAASDLLEPVRQLLEEVSPCLS